MTSDAIFTSGRTAVITGGANGIGLASAKRCVGFGMNVLIADRDQAELNNAKATLAGMAGEAQVFAQALDVADFAAVQALADLAFDRFGDVALLMNNAGAGFRGLSLSNLEGWRRTFEVNLFGVVNGVQAFGQRMVDQGRPAAIVNTGSKQGITNPPGDPAYNATKAAVKSLTESLAHDLRNIEGCQVTAHLLVPGFTFTGLMQKRLPEKPPGAWTAEQVADRMIESLQKGEFYIICPDNETSSEMDQKRIRWGAEDLVRSRPALSRWHPDYAAEFAEHMARPATTD
ncbi:MAG: SDR family NAD(P)-dependent oxidoreductase [Phenylobacterium sp.]